MYIEEVMFGNIIPHVTICYKYSNLVHTHVRMHTTYGNAN